MLVNRGEPDARQRDASAGGDSFPGWYLYDMDSWSTREVAGWLGVSVPAVHRAVKRMGLEPDQTAKGLRFDTAQVAELTRDVGSVPKIRGWHRNEIQVLAALSRAPLGLRSVRAVARRAGVSPTTATKGLEALRSGGLVKHTRRMFAEGRAVEGDLWQLDFASRQWSELAPVVSATVLPAQRGERDHTQIPRRLRHHFWNSDVSKLEPADSSGYVVTRLLLSRDPQAAAWVAANATPEALAEAARNRGATPEDRQMAANIAARR